MDLHDPAARNTTDAVRPGTRRLLVTFLALTLLAVNQLFVLSDVADRFWAWPIPTEMTAAFLGAAYSAGFVLSALALREDRWSRIRVPVLTVTVFTVLTGLATLDHAHKLRLMSGEPVARAASWVWLAVYVVIPFACAVVVVRQERDRRGVAAPVGRPIPRWLHALLVVEGGVLFVAGIVMFAGGAFLHHHTARVTHFWPWEVTPLSSMVIGAWLIAFGVAAALVLRDRDLGRMFVAATTYMVFGVFELVAVIWYAPQVDVGDPWLWSYVAVLAAITATGAFGAWAARRPSADGGSSEGDRISAPSSGVAG